MAEGNSPKGGASVFTKKVQRQLSRSKEKVHSHLNIFRLKHKNILLSAPSLDLSACITGITKVRQDGGVQRRCL